MQCQIISQKGVGKTSLIELIQEELNHDEQLQFVSHHGDILMCIFDLTNLASFEYLQTQVPQSKQRALLVGTKVDLIDLRQVTSESAIKFANRQGLAYHEVSCITRENISALLNALLSPHRQTLSIVKFNRKLPIHSSEVSQTESESESGSPLEQLSARQKTQRSSTSEKLIQPKKIESLSEIYKTIREEDELEQDVTKKSQEYQYRSLGMIPQSTVRSYQQSNRYDKFHEIMQGMQQLQAEISEFQESIQEKNIELIQKPELIEIVHIYCKPLPTPVKEPLPTIKYQTTIESPQISSKQQMHKETQTTPKNTLQQITEYQENDIEIIDKIPLSYQSQIVRSVDIYNKPKTIRKQFKLLNGKLITITIDQNKSIAKNAHEIALSNKMDVQQYRRLLEFLKHE